MKMHTRSLHLALAMIGAFILHANAVAQVTPQRPDTATDRHARPPANEVQRAKRIADDLMATIRQHPQASYDEMGALLADIVKDQALPELDGNGRKEVDAYIRTKGVDLQPIIERLRKHEQRKAVTSSFNACYTYCMLCFEVECGTNCPIGFCFGVWDCTDGMGAHTCNDESCKECGDDGVCPTGYRCARYVFKKDECVKTCDSDSDCPTGQRCKKPFGTSFYRCK